MLGTAKNALGIIGTLHYCVTQHLQFLQRVMVTVPYKMPVRISKDEIPGEVPVPLVTTHPILKITSHFLIINQPHWKLLQNKKN